MWHTSHLVEIGVLLEWGIADAFSSNGFTHWADSDLDHPEILTCRYEMLCRICLVQIQSRKHALDHADYTAPTRQHELDRHKSGIYVPCLADRDDEVGSMICDI